jgi:hypothetical protein
VRALTSSQKGAAAESELAAAAIRLGVVVLRPLCEGARYDLVLDTSESLIRVQCKWARRTGGGLTVRTSTCRHTPRGYVRSTYYAFEVDAIGVFSPDTERCYLVPIADVAGRHGVCLRLEPAGNSQEANIRWARDYELARSLGHWPPQRRSWQVALDGGGAPR